jgi:hypothetical protein
VYALHSEKAAELSCLLDFGTEEVLLPVSLDSGADVSLAPSSIVYLALTLMLFLEFLTVNAQYA